MSILSEDPVRRYLNLPYRITLMRDGADEERPWRAEVEDLPGCEARGATATDAAARVPAALAQWVATARAEGREVPEPRDARAYSGKLLLRMPRSLHGELAQAAERDQVSLNAYINALLAAAVEWRRPEGAQPAVSDQGRRSWQDAPHEGRRAQPQRFLVIALAANVAVVAIAAAIAVILLLSAA